MSEEVTTGITSGWPLVALGLSLLAGYVTHVIGSPGTRTASDAIAAAWSCCWSGRSDM